MDKIREEAFKILMADKNYQLALRLIRVCTNSSWNKKDYVAILGFCIALHKQGNLSLHSNFTIKIDEKKNIGIRDFWETEMLDSIALNEIITILQNEVDFNHTELYEHVINIIKDDFKHDYIESGFWKELPEIVVLFISQLLKDLNVQNVFCPFANLSPISSADNSISILNYEEHIEIWLIGFIRLLLKGADTSQYVNAPSNKILKELNNEYDSIIITLFDNPFSKQHNLYPFSVHTIKKNLKSNGYVIIVVPETFLTKRNKYSEILLKQNCIYSIIVLDYLFSDNIHWAILILKKCKNEKICMVDFREGELKLGGNDSILNPDYNDIKNAIETGNKQHMCFVTSNDIVNYNYSLHPSFYVVNDTIYPDIPEGYQLCTISDFLKPIDKAFLIQKKQMYKDLKFLVDSRNLFSNNYSYELDENAIGIDYVQGNLCILDRDLLLFPNFKHTNENPMFYKHHKLCAEVCIDDSIYAVGFDSNKIYPFYLCNEFNKEYVGKQLDKLFSIYSDEDVSIEDILTIKILLPDLDTQKNLYHQEEKKFWESKLHKASSDFEKRIKQIHEDVNNQLKIQRHCIRDGYLGAIKDYASLLSDYIAKKNLGNDYVVPSMGYTLNMLMTDMNDRIKNMAKKVSSLTAEYEIGLGENLDLCKRIYDFKSQGNYIINHYIDEKIDIKEGAIVYFNNNCFNDMMESIIGNAVKHGFTNSTNKNIIEIKLSSDNNDKMYNLQINNNGSPLPDGMDTCRYGLRGETAGKYGNEGLGGYIVKTVVEHFKGELEIKNMPNSTFPVRIIIKLPYKN